MNTSHDDFSNQLFNEICLDDYVQTKKYAYLRASRIEFDYRTVYFLKIFTEIIHQIMKPTRNMISNFRKHRYFQTKNFERKLDLPNFPEVFGQ